MASEFHPHAVIEKIVREEWGRVLSILVGQFRDFELAEDALQEALILALDRWRPKHGGFPANPCGWLLKIAKRKIIDQIRRRESFRGKEEQIVANIESNHSSFDLPDEMKDDEAIPDERLRLIFTCCHPALAEEARVALTLQTLGGMKTLEVARAFLVPEATMAQRLVRAKRKIKTARIPYEIPGPEHLDERLDSVLSVIYLIFNEGYSTSSGDDAVRTELCDDAIRLGRILVSIAPEHPEAKGLLALMLLHHARAPARIGTDGRLVTLDCQDRTLWDREKIGEGLAILGLAINARRPGAYQIQAAISALHAEAPNHASTDWQQIYQLYQELYRHRPSPVVSINSIVALSFAGGPEAALEALEEIRNEPKLQNYLPLHAAHADFLRRAGAPQQAAIAYRKAIKLSGNTPERSFLEERLREMEKG